MRVATATGNMFNLFKPMFPDIFIVGNNGDISDLDLLILTGGEDVNPKRYNGLTTHSYWNDDRDDTEFSLVKKVMDFNKDRTKILGICRGHQLLNIFFGGNLVEDLRSAGKNHGYFHKVYWTHSHHPLSWISGVNSLHHQAVSAIGKGGRPIAIEPMTGVIEAMSWGNFAFGVQFHPEMMENGFKYRFFNVIKEWVKNGTSI